MSKKAQQSKPGDGLPADPADPTQNSSTPENHPMAKSLAPARLALISIGYREFAMPIELAARFMNEAVQVKDGYLEGKTVRWIEAEPERMSMNVVEADSIEPLKPLSLIQAEKNAKVEEVSKECECSAHVARQALQRADWSTWNAKKQIENGALIEVVAAE